MMEEKVTVTLDFTKCRYLEDIYAEMRTKMEWEDWYGDNLDALWDILTGLTYKGDNFIIRRPEHYINVPHKENAIFTDYVNKLCETFGRAQKQDELTVKIEYVQEETKN